MCEQVVKREPPAKLSMFLTDAQGRTRWDPAYRSKSRGVFSLVFGKKHVFSRQIQDAREWELM